METQTIEEKVRSYLCNIKNEYIIHECELIIVLIMNVLKNILIQIYIYIF